MIKIIAAHQRENDKGKFTSLEIMGDIELVQSQNTGRFYATAKRCYIGSTFSLEIAQSMLGQQLPGTINRVPCDPYTYKLPEGGQEITLSHRYSYVPPEEKQVETRQHFPEELNEIQ